MKILYRYIGYFGTCPYYIKYTNNLVIRTPNGSYRYSHYSYRYSHYFIHALSPYELDEKSREIILYYRAKRVHYEAS